MKWMWTALLVFAVAVGCASDQVRTVREFQSAQAARDRDDALRLLAPDARTWFGAKEGEGKPWTLSGGWYEWDQEFRGRYLIDHIREGPGWVRVDARETNEFYRLIERAPTRATLTYYFDAQGRLTGRLYEPVEERGRPADRMAEFKVWAGEQHAAELAALLSNGEIKPGREEARRWRALLVEWRREAGLPAIEE